MAFRPKAPHAEGAKQSFSVFEGVTKYGQLPPEPAPNVILTVPYPMQTEELDPLGVELETVLRACLGKNFPLEHPVQHAYIEFRPFDQFSKAVIPSYKVSVFHIGYILDIIFSKICRGHLTTRSCHFWRILCEVGIFALSLTYHVITDLADYRVTTPGLCHRYGLRGPAVFLIAHDFELELPGVVWIGGSHWRFATYLYPDPCKLLAQTFISEAHSGNKLMFTDYADYAAVVVVALALFGARCGIYRTNQAVEMGISILRDKMYSNRNMYRPFVDAVCEYYMNGLRFKPMKALDHRRKEIVLALNFAELQAAGLLCCLPQPQLATADKQIPLLLALRQFSGTTCVRVRVIEHSHCPLFVTVQMPVHPVLVQAQFNMVAPAILIEPPTVEQLLPPKLHGDVTLVTEIIGDRLWLTAFEMLCLLQTTDNTFGFFDGKNSNVALYNMVLEAVFTDKTHVYKGLVASEYVRALVYQAIRKHCWDTFPYAIAELPRPNDYDKLHLLTVARLSPLLMSPEGVKLNMLSLAIDIGAPHVISDLLLSTAQMLDPEAFAHYLVDAAPAPLAICNKDVVLSCYCVTASVYLQGNAAGAMQLLKLLADAYKGLKPNHRPRQVPEISRLKEDLLAVMGLEQWKSDSPTAPKCCVREFIRLFARLRTTMVPYGMSNASSLLMWREVSAFRLRRLFVPEPAVSTHWMDALHYQKVCASALRFSRQPLQLVVRTEESDDGWGSYLNRVDPGFLIKSRKRSLSQSEAGEGAAK